MRRHLLGCWTTCIFLTACVTGVATPSGDLQPDSDVVKDTADVAPDSDVLKDAADAAPGPCTSNEACDDGNHCTNDFCSNGTCYNQPEVAWWQSSVAGYGFKPLVRFVAPNSVYTGVPTWPSSNAEPTMAALYRRDGTNTTNNQKSFALPSSHFDNRVVAIAEVDGEIAIGGFGRFSKDAPNWGFWIWRVTTEVLPVIETADWAPAFVPQVWAQVNKTMVFAGGDSQGTRLRTASLEVGVNHPSPWWQHSASLLSAVGQADGMWLLVDSKPDALSVYRANVADAVTETTLEVPYPPGKTGFVTTVLAVPGGGALLGGQVHDVGDTGAGGLADSARPWILRLDSGHNVALSQVLDTLTQGTQIMSGTLDLIPGVTPPKEPFVAWAGFTHSTTKERDAWVALTDVYGRLKVAKTLPGSDDDYLTSIVPHPDGGFLTAGIAKPGTLGTVELRRIGPWGSASCEPEDLCDAPRECAADENPCTFEVCQAGVCNREPLPESSQCGENGLSCQSGECAP